jgi:GNAT superfamily N-acetyltransferase
MNGFKKFLIESEIPSIQNTTPNDQDEILTQSFVECFPQYNNPEIIDFVKNAVDWDISLKATVDNKIIAFYLLGTRPLSETMSDENAHEQPEENLQRYDSMNGVEGVALGVIPEFRSKGIATQLKNKIRNSGFDFIYGMQYKELGNLENWTSGSTINRRLVAQSETDAPVYITIEDISPKAKNSTLHNKELKNS